MRRMTMRTLVLMGVLACGVLACSGAAQAQLFLWSGAVPTLVLVLAEGKQIFIPKASLPELRVICSHFALDGKLAAARSSALKVAGEYTGCSYLGLAATVSPVELEFGADETLSVVGKEINITVPSIACNIKIEQGEGKNIKLPDVTYLTDLNNALAILGHAFVSGVKSLVNSASCMGEMGHQTTGEYRGLFLIRVDAAGRLSWC